MINALQNRSVDVDFGTRSGTVTIAKLTPWEKGRHCRLYFTLSHAVKDFPTKGFIDLSGNASVNPALTTVQVGKLFIVIEDGFASSKRKRAEVVRAITELFTLPEEESDMDDRYDSRTMILATSLRDMIKRDTALYHGKLRCLPYDKGYGYSLRWGAETIALAKPCKVYGVPDQLGRIQPWGAGGFYFDRALVESIMARIHEGEVPDTFECFMNGGPDGVYSTAEEARAHALSYPGGFEWSIYKNGYLFEHGVIAAGGACHEI